MWLVFSLQRLSLSLDIEGAYHRQSTGELRMIRKNPLNKHLLVSAFLSLAFPNTIASQIKIRQELRWTYRPSGVDLR